MADNGQKEQKPSSRPRWRGWAVWLAAGLVAVSLGLGVYLRSGEERALKPSAEKSEPLRLGLAMQPSSGLFMIALEKGMFSANGLDVSVKEYPSGKRAMIEGLFTGRVDAVTTADTPIVFAGLDRSDFRIVASIFFADNVNRIIARKDAGIAKPTDLARKHVATQKASAVHFFLHLFLLEHGFSDKAIQLSFMKAEELPKALAGGEIDAFSMREPYISRAKAMLGGNAVIFSASGIYEQVEEVVVTEDIIDKKPETVRKLLQALLQAEAFIDDYPEQSMTIIAHRLGVDRSSIKDIWPEVKLRVSLEQSLVLRLEDQAYWAIKAGLTSHTAVPNYLSVIHTESLEAIRPDAVSIIRKKSRRVIP